VKEGRLTAALGLACVLVVTAPVLLQPASRALGLQFVDGFGTQWWFWYLGEVLAGREDLVHTDLLFFPTGKDVFAHTGGNLLDALLAWPLRALLGPVVGYNAWIALVVLTNFAAGARLGRAFTGEPAWLAGVALALNPWVIQEIGGGRPTQAWIALPALALAGVWSARRPIGAVLTGVAVAASGWLYWYGGLTIGLVAVVAGLVRLVVLPDRLRSALLLTLAGAVALALVAPAVWWMHGEIGAGAVPGLLALDGTGLLAPLRLTTDEGGNGGLQVLAPLLGRSGGLLEVDGALVFRSGQPSLSFASGLGGAVAAVIAWRAGQRAACLAALAVVVAGLLLACGPAFVVGETMFANRPWVWMVSHVDVMRRWWWPARAIVAVFFGLAALLPLLSRVPGLRWIFLAAMFVEGFRTAQLPVATWDAAVPAPVACLRDAPPGAVIDLPILSDQRNLWFQTEHHHPLLSGMLLLSPEFGSAPLNALRSSNGFLDLLLDYGEHRYTRDPTFDEADRASLIAAGYRYVLVDQSRFWTARPGGRDGERKSAWPRLLRLLRPLLGEPAIDADGVALFTLDGSDLPCVVPSAPP
jgi:hypothetical protein